MAKIIIKKRIDLDFLGEEYKGGFVEFKSMSVRDIESRLGDMEAVADDNVKAVNLMLELLAKQFIKGTFKVDGEESDITKDDLGDFDMEAVSKFFEILSGRGETPKA